MEVLPLITVMTTRVLAAACAPSDYRDDDLLMEVLPLITVMTTRVLAAACAYSSRSIHAVAW